MASPASHIRRVAVAVGVTVTVLLAAASWGPANDVDRSAAADPRVPALCFAPGTPLDRIAEAYERAGLSFRRHSLASESMLKFELAWRWSATATDGGGLLQGDPMTLTWSVVPDGTEIPPEFGYPAAGSDLRAFLNGIYGSMGDWLPLFQQVFDRWGELTGITYVYEPSDDGALLSGLGGVTGVRGDIRIGGKLIDGGPGGILAYNYYPNDGDMVIDTGDSFYNDTSADSLGLRNVVSHEHGHGLGFDHVCPINGTKLMEPFVSSSFDGPQHDDILAANRFYGDRFEHDDTPGSAAALGVLDATSEDNLSIDGDADVDFFGFSVADGSALDVTVTPLGSTYLSGPQNGDGSCSDGSSFNSLVIHDLAMRVLDTDGVSELAAADDHGAGQAEALADVILPSGAGTYFVEVSADTTDAAQLFELSLSVSASTGIFSDGFESGSTSAWSSSSP